MMNPRIDIIPKWVVNGLTSEDKIRFIVGKVKKNVILVLEDVLRPEEQAGLIRETMLEIDYETFSGVELLTFNKNPGSKGFMRWKNKPNGDSKITIVAPANSINILRDTSSIISLMLK
ncbi:MAG: OapB/ArvB family protein [Candidatus Jordarchaeum sp.]|uniref:OapB/ArvB family protein n=1 Tax=Candidatus Jordarchaeum sp. TaxID=2823881 RepID=UPI00404A3ECE